MLNVDLVDKYYKNVHTLIFFQFYHNGSIFDDPIADCEVRFLSCLPKKGIILLKYFRNPSLASLLVLLII